MIVEVSTITATPCAAAVLKAANAGEIVAPRTIGVSCPLPVPGSTGEIQSHFPANDDADGAIRTPERRSRTSTGLTQAEVTAAVTGWALAAANGRSFTKGGLFITGRWESTRLAGLTPANATTVFFKRFRERLSREVGSRVEMIFIAAHERSEVNGLHTHAVLRLDGIPDNVPVELLIRHHAGALYTDAVKVQRVNDRGPLVYLLKGAVDRPHLRQQLGQLTKGERKILRTRSRNQGIVPGNRMSISTSLREPRTDWTRQKPAAWALDAA